MLLLKIWQKHSFSVIAAILAGSVALFFTRSIGVDEAWIGEQAYWLHKDGYTHSMLWQGYFLHEKHILVQHFLFLKITAWLLHVLPWSIFSLRIIPLVVGFALAGLVYRFCRKELTWAEPEAILPAAVFLAYPVVIEFLTYYRPELVVALLGFVSFWLLFRSEKNGWLAAAAGLFAGLATLTHLNGMVFVGAGGLLLLIKQNWKGAFLFGLAALAAFSPYLLLILSDTDTFFYQLSSGASAASGHLRWYAPLLNLLHEQKRFFHGPFTVFSSALLLASLWLLYKSQPLSDKLWFVIWYTVLLVSFVGMVAPSKTIKYAILYLPQLAILIGFAFQIYQKQKQKLSKAFRWLYIFSWLGFTFMIPVSFAKPFIFDELSTRKINEELATAIPEMSRCLAPMQFVFNDIETYNTVGLTTLQALKILTVEGIISYCGQHNIEYLILNDAWQEQIPDFEQKKEVFSQHFIKIKEVKSHRVYKFSK